MKPEKQGSQHKKSGLIVDPKDLQGTLRFIGGSASDLWNNILANQAIGSLSMAYSEEERDRQRTATVVALAAIGPKDELEAMMAAQLLAAHNATMECYRRAMLPEQTFEGRSENLNQANKLSRTYAVLLDALNRHRGKGQQKVTVEHVNVHSGGQAVVGIVSPPGGGARTGPVLGSRTCAAAVVATIVRSMFGSITTSVGPPISSRCSTLSGWTSTGGRRH